MTLTSTLVGFICAVALPAAALAQVPAWALDGPAPCCATLTGGDALAAAVLLPAPMVLPTDARATAVAAAVLLPQAEHADHAAHAMADMACCQHGAPSAVASPGRRHSMTDVACSAEGCDMPCCEKVSPEEVPPLR
jgi:hypothetical protein